MKSLVAAGLIAAAVVVAAPVADAQTAMFINGMTPVLRPPDEEHDWHLTELGGRYAADDIAADLVFGVEDRCSHQASFRQVRPWGRGWSHPQARLRDQPISPPYVGFGDPSSVCGERRRTITKSCSVCAPSWNVLVPATLKPFLR